MIELKCPRCGAMLKSENDLDVFYCQYCGSKIILDEQPDNLVNAKAKIKMSQQRQKTERHKIDAKYENEQKNNEFKFKKEKYKDKSLLISLFVFMLFIALMLIMISIEVETPDRQLNKLIENTQNYIQSGDYDSARLETNKIHYDGLFYEFSHHKKWNSARKELLKQIEAAEKEAIKQEKQTSDNSWSWLPWVD